MTEVPSAPPPQPYRKPAHYRLSTATWEMILQEYREGGTVPELSLKWRVSEHAMRARITRHNATKRDWGDQQAIAQAAARGAEIEAARKSSPQARAARLFEPAGEAEADAADPAALASSATLASGRAMKGRLWSEAKALAGLAESYSRLADKGGRGGGGSIETMDLNLLSDIIEDASGSVGKRFHRFFDGRHDPEEAIKARYWSRIGRQRDAIEHSMKELMFRAVYAEREVRRLGGTPKVNTTDVEIEDWVRDWLGEPASEATLHHRTKLGEWPWR